MINAKILNEAKAELFDAIVFHENKAKGTGLDLQNEVKSSLEIIKRFPECCTLRKDKTRRYLINRFPYLIIYTYYKDHIWIIAFAHCKRKPNYWLKRIKKNPE